MFEAVEFIEEEVESGRPAPIPTESILGTFEVEADAVMRARAARAGFMSGSRGGYAWWIVREQGARLANWISDSRSDREFALDVTSGELTEVPQA
ncbi:MAG: hypothetical protein OEM84_06890 [Acidimicrobiia bacterium]|nr:hypothetical protein [Acidimicrobiia bacterium]MDH5615472.1 hypothetical protein [Acidimicrobiia bacterium]